MAGEIFQKKNTHFLSIASWERPGLIAGFTTRCGGVSQAPFSSLNVGLHVGDNPEDVVKNRMIVANSLATDLSQYVFCEQTHDATIQKVTLAECGKGAFDYTTALKATDGVYTKEKDVFLALGFADCVPIFFFAPNHQLVGLVHAGWRGTVLKIARKMVHTWHTEENVPLEDIQVVIGPSVDVTDYVVDDVVIQKVEEVLGEVAASTYEEITTGQYRLDLKKVNVELLKQAGLSTNSMEVTTYATKDQSLFFSHRLEKGQTGRMCAIIGWKGGE